MAQLNYKEYREKVFDTLFHIQFLIHSNVGLNIASIRDTIFVVSFSSGEMFPSSVAFQNVV